MRPMVERELAALAKQCRRAAGKSKAEVARELRLSAPTVFNAEERPEMSLTRVRIRMIERYSRYRIEGPVFLLRRT